MHVAGGSRDDQAGPLLDGLNQAKRRQHRCLWIRRQGCRSYRSRNFAERPPGYERMVVAVGGWINDQAYPCPLESEAGKRQCRNDVGVLRELKRRSSCVTFKEGGRLRNGGQLDQFLSVGTLPSLRRL